MSGSEVLQNNTGAILDPDYIYPPGIGFNGGGKSAAAPDGQILCIANHQFVAVEAARPGVPGAWAVLAVGFCFAQVIGAGLQQDLPVRTDGSQQFIHITDSDGFPGFHLCKFCGLLRR